MSRPSLKRALTAIQKLYPTKLADSSWDNTGLLVESAFDDSRPLKVLLAIDLTQAVADEAIRHNAGLIMAYHPFIFKGLKAITQQDPQQKSLLKLIKNDISVYSPHTAVDSAKGGVNDFLAEGISEGLEVDSVVPLEPHKTEEDCGMGRLVTLKNPVSLESLVGKAKQSLGLSHVQVAVAHDQDRQHPIQKIAICAGSGGSVFRGVDADLFYTGELSHHEALYFKELGSSVIVCNHSNTERAFLQVFKKQLQQELDDVEIIVSAEDKDPFQTW